jgi:phosphotransferase system enzyme I (PtsI)
MSNGEASSGGERRFHGIAVSPGIARGTLFVHRPEDEEPPVRRIEESEIPNEIARFENALLATRSQILEMQERIATSIGAKDASIFDAHLLVVEDRTLIDEVCAICSARNTTSSTSSRRSPGSTRRRSAKLMIPICASGRSTFTT